MNHFEIDIFIHRHFMFKLLSSINNLIFFPYNIKGLVKLSPFQTSKLFMYFSCQQLSSLTDQINQLPLSWFKIEKENSYKSNYMDVSWKHIIWRSHECSISFGNCIFATSLALQCQYTGPFLFFHVLHTAKSNLVFLHIKYEKISYFS